MCASRRIRGSSSERAVAPHFRTLVADLRIVLAAIEPPLADAVVSPANSYGFMDGGIDALYMQHFGDEIQLRVRRQIYDHHAGELLVGVADIVETGHKRIPFLIAAPTMRVPMVLQNSPNAYLAARAVLLLTTRGVFTSGHHTGQPVADHVRAVALPGLGTGVGRIGFNTCARQVRAAIDDVLVSGFQMPKSWAEASERHQLLYTDRPTRLQY
jgi:O-acetyl-ADP-ribose deacetylase (regulator of RNase III)